MNYKVDVPDGRTRRFGARIFKLFVTIEIGSKLRLMENLFGGISSLRSCDQGTSAEGSIVSHINPILLYYKEILARTMLSEMKTSRLFIFYYQFM